MYESLNMMTKKFDKSSWSEEERSDTYDYSTLEGPWNDEPDKAQWIDPETDLDCLIVRNRMGNLCGYVGVTQDHPWFERYYSQCTEETCGEEFCYDHSPAAKVHAHGGLTFSDKCSEENSDGICHVPQNGRTPHVWWFGFDCGHAFDFSPGLRAFELSKPEIFGKRSGRDGSLFGEKYRDFDYVVEEVSNLARQLKEVQ